MFVEVMFHGFVLRKWRQNPQTPKREYGFVSAWRDGSPENDLPLSAEEVARDKGWMREKAPLSFLSIFPEELH